MKKTLIAATVLTAGVFGTGYTVGQLTGITGSSAASAGPTVVQRAVGAVTTPPGPGNGAPDAPRNDSPHADGTVTAINGDTLTISAGTDPSGTTEYTGVMTVTLSGNTTYDAGHDSTAAAGKSSIKVGSYVIVNGTLSSDGKSIAATSIGVNAVGPVPGR